MDNFDNSELVQIKANFRNLCSVCLVVYSQAAITVIPKSRVLAASFPLSLPNPEMRFNYVCSLDELKSFEV